jgi:flagella basal body P-ring formation protein FlgA
MHLVILTLLVAAIAFAGFAPAYAAASLRSVVTVSGPDVRVDDIFPGAASRAVVARTPVPGRKLLFDAVMLQGIAKRYGVDWQPETRFAQAVVSRDTRTVEGQEIEDALLRALRAKGLGEDVRIDLTNRSLSIPVANGPGTPYVIESPVMDEQTRRISAVVAVAVEGAETMRYRIDATSYTVIEIPVLNRRVRRGETIQKADISWKPVRRETVGRNTILDAEALQGQAARRYLAEERPLNTDDVEAPVLVRKGNLVTVYFETSNLLLSAKARANDDGALNQTIRVVNVRSKKEIEAVVRSATSVYIPNGMPVATN